MKKCRICKKLKSQQNFKQRLSGKNKGCFDSYCRLCNKKYMKHYQKLWGQSLKGKMYKRNAQKLYRLTLKGKNYLKLYAQLPRRKLYCKIWRQTIKGKYTRKVCRLNRKKRTLDLTIKIVQQVYEDNIKKYGILTCYLCLNPIKLGNDHLDHKQPLAKKGTNKHKNLGIACSHCNLSKGKKTIKEFKLK